MFVFFLLAYKTKTHSLNTDSPDINLLEKYTEVQLITGA